MDKREKIVVFTIILIATVFVSIPLFNFNLDIWVDDGVQHICRLMGTFQSISEGQLFPVIMSKFCNNFGYSWNIFYSPLTAYFPLIFKLIGCTFTGCLKLSMIIGSFLSGLFMFMFVKKISKSSKIGVIAAILYIAAPYRLTDMYIRVAFAELISFVFIPLVFLGLYNLFYEEKKKEWILIIGATGLVLTHLIITMYTAIIALIYVLINIKKLKEKNILKKLVISTLTIIVLTAFFWVPLLEHKVNVNYEVFKPGRMERIDVLEYYKLEVHELIFTQKSEIYVFEIGIVSMIGFILTPFTIYKLKKDKVDKENKAMFQFYLFSLMMAVICLIMTLEIFPFEKLPSIFRMIQFTFRLLEFSSFFLSIVVAINFGVILKKLKWRDVVILSILICGMTVRYTDKLYYDENKNEENLWPAVKLTSKTIRVHAGMASMEYLPSNAFENRSYLEDREDRVIVIEGVAYISDEQKDGTNMIFKVNNIENQTVIELPYIYYLGYNVTLEKNDGSKINLNTFETENGFLGIKINEENNGTIKVKYTGTILMKISYFVSLTAIISWFIILIYIKLNKKEKINSK